MYSDWVLYVGSVMSGQLTSDDVKKAADALVKMPEPFKFIVPDGMFDEAVMMYPQVDIYSVSGNKYHKGGRPND